MTDVPLAVAVIGIITPAVAATLPQVITWIKDGGRDKRDRAERLEAERLRLAREERGECVKLMRLARDFRVQVENAHESQGADLAKRVREIRASVANVNGQADDVGFLLPEAEAAASALAAEVGRLAATVSDNKNKAGGGVIPPPDLRRFDRCIRDFKTAALAALNGQPAQAAGSADGVMDAQRLALAPAGEPLRARLGLRVLGQLHRLLPVGRGKWGVCSVKRVLR